MDPKTAIAQNLLSRRFSKQAFINTVRSVIEDSIIHVLDGSETLDELEGCEKTTFGVKFEKRFTTALNLPRKRFKKDSKLDTVIDGIDVDIKTTLGGRNWMIPREAVDQWCLLLRVDYKKGRFDLGILQTVEDRLNKGKNRDTKVTVSSAGRKDIEWIIKDEACKCHNIREFGTKDFEDGLMSWV